MTGQSSPVIVPAKWYQPFFWKLRNKSWWWFLPLMNLLHDKTKHCGEPEYFKANPKLVRWTGGIKVFAWTWICGHHLGFSLHMGNIYWKLWKNK